MTFSLHLWCDTNFWAVTWIFNIWRDQLCLFTLPNYFHSHLSFFSNGLNLKWDRNLAHHQKINTWLSELCFCSRRNYLLSFFSNWRNQIRSSGNIVSRIKLQFVTLNIVRNCLSPITKFHFLQLDPVLAFKACGPGKESVSHDHMDIRGLQYNTNKRLKIRRN